MEKKGLLIIKSSVNLSEDHQAAIRAHLEPVAVRLGLSVLIASDPLDVSIHYDPTPMIEALKEATRALNAAADRLNVTESMDTRDLSSQIETVALQPITQPRGSAR